MGEAKACSHGDVAGDSHRRLGKRSTESLGGLQELGFRRIRNDDQEFLASVPATNVTLPQLLGRPPHDFAQDGIAGRVSPAVVDGLEMVDVEEHHAKGRGALDVLRPGKIEARIQRAPRERARQRVDVGQRLEVASPLQERPVVGHQALEDTALLDDRGHLVRDLPEDRLVASSYAPF
jgi:hypothetical protein